MLSNGIKHQHIADNIRLLSQIIYDVCEQNYLKSISPSLSRNQLHILKVLMVSGAKSVSEIAEIFNVSAPAASRTVEKLVKGKLVTRTPVNSDRRSVTVNLTKKGETVVIEYDNIRFQKQSEALGHFTPAELKTFNTLLEKYIHHCVEQEDKISLICLQCDGTFRENCQIKEQNQTCFYAIHHSLN